MQDLSFTISKISETTELEKDYDLDLMTIEKIIGISQDAIDEANHTAKVFGINTAMLRAFDMVYPRIEKEYFCDKYLQ